MGSAKEPGSLQLLGQGAVAEDVCRPEDSSPGCLHSSRCGAGQLTMRNCCVPELSGQGSQERRAEAPAMDKPLEPEPELEPAAGGRALVLQGTCAGAGPPEKGEESLAVAVSCLGRNGERRSGPPAPPDGSSIPRSPPAGDGAAVASAEAPSPRLLPEPCLKGHGKDLASAPAALKHVAFREPANRDPQPDGAGAAAASPELAPVPPTGLQDRRQEQARASQGDESVGAPGAARLSDGGAGAPCGGAGGKVPPSLAELQAQLGSLTPPGAGSKGAAALPSLAGAQESAPGAPGREAASGPEARLEAEVTPSRPIPAPLSRKAGPAGSADARPEACSAATHSVKGHGPSGESRAAPAEARGGTGPPQSTAEGSPAQEQRRAKGTEAGPGEEAVRASRTVELLSKTYSLEVTPPPQDAGTQDAGTQAGTRVSLVSVAVSPINPPDGSMAFTFHSRGQGPSALASPGPELKPSKKDAEMQVSIPVESRSVATGPMTPVAKSPQASYPEVRVKGAQEEPPEPIREVSWDEKGMTWEVYGASVEVEVLGMAIQKHLEKQIEEHGRQTVMTPQSTRASSIKGAPRTGEVKRPPTMFRALLQGMRRPRCCSRAGPAAE